MKLWILQLTLEPKPPGCELLKFKEHSLFTLWLQHPAACMENRRCLMNECMRTLAPSSFHCPGQHGTATQWYFGGCDHSRQLNWTIRALWFRLGPKLSTVEILPVKLTIQMDLTLCSIDINCIYFLNWHIAVVGLASPTDVAHVYCYHHRNRKWLLLFLKFFWKVDDTIPLFLSILMSLKPLGRKVPLYLLLRLLLPCIWNTSPSGQMTADRTG